MDSALEFWLLEKLIKEPPKSDCAKDLLSGWLNTAPASVTELRVIHGYQRGTALRDMLRSGFSHPRVKAVLPSLNPGETRLVLKKAPR